MEDILKSPIEKIDFILNLYRGGVENQLSQSTGRRKNSGG
jgi:hypothetical protein